MISIAAGNRIFVYTQPTDMRKSFNGLSGIVTQHFEVDLFAGHLFVFFNRKRDFVKILMWDQDGLSLSLRRLGLRGRLPSATGQRFERLRIVAAGCLASEPP